MNIERIRHTLGVNELVFSYSGLFTINSGVLGEKTRIPCSLPGLFATVALPRFGLTHQFSNYPIPYKWYNDSRTLDAGAEERQSTGSGVVYHYSQSTTIGIFTPSVFYRLLIEKPGWRITDISVNGWLKTKNSTATNARTKWRSVDKPLPENDRPRKVNESNAAEQVFGFSLPCSRFYRLVTNSSAEKIMAAGSMYRLFSKVALAASQDHAQVLEKIFGNTAAQASTLRMNADAFSIDTLKENERSLDTTRLNDVRPQDLIWQTTKTLGVQRIEEQHQHKVQFEQLQQMMQKSEQLTSQEFRRLQQSIHELKNVMSVPQQPVVVSTRRPPSVYGRLK